MLGVEQWISDAALAITKDPALITMNGSTTETLIAPSKPLRARNIRVPWAHGQASET